MRATSDVIFRTQDLAGAKEYYGKTLGLPLVIETERLVGFDAGALTLYFERGDDNGAVFEFAVDDVGATKARLVADGCLLVEEIPEMPRCYLRDPFGVTFNLTQQLTVR